MRMISRMCDVDGNKQVQTDETDAVIQGNGFRWYGHILRKNEND